GPARPRRPPCASSEPTTPPDISRSGSPGPDPRRARAVAPRATTIPALSDIRGEAGAERFKGIGGMRYPAADDGEIAPQVGQFALGARERVRSRHADVGVVAGAEPSAPAVLTGEPRGVPGVGGDRVVPAHQVLLPPLGRAVDREPGAQPPDRRPGRIPVSPGSVGATANRDPETPHEAERRCPVRGGLPPGAH